MTEDELRALVKAIVTEVVKGEPQAAAGPSGNAEVARHGSSAAAQKAEAAPEGSASSRGPKSEPPSAAAQKAEAAPEGSASSRGPKGEPPSAAAQKAEAAPEGPAWSRGPKHRPLTPPRNARALSHFVTTTPSRIVTGRTGTRYLTSSYLGLRADHAIALDAVESEVDEAWATSQGWLALRSRSKDHAHFLLHPDDGRRLDDASRAKCSASADKGVDVQLIAGDGLSAYALEVNGPALIKALAAAHTAKGFKVGKPLFVKFARIGVQDEIGVLTQAKSTIIIVGERPGLGTGDSLSIYTAFAPKLGQDNSEKDCISNVRDLGFTPERAAAKCAELMKASFAAGGGGVKLTGGDPAFRPHVANH